MATLISAQTISSVREVWWDIRPHPSSGRSSCGSATACRRLYEISWAAALSQCLVEMLNGQLDRGYTLPVPKGWTVRENKWRAARYGIEAELIVDDDGRTRRCARCWSELVDELVPVARAAGLQRRSCCGRRRCSMSARATRANGRTPRRRAGTCMPSSMDFSPRCARTHRRALRL